MSIPVKSSRKRATMDPSAGPSNKKARFADATEESDALTGNAFEEQVQGDLETPSLSRKGGIKVEGYDTDSSDDGEGVVESRKRSLRKKNVGDDDEDDDDMFGGGKTASDEDAPRSKKKETKFMNLGDIEGQEFGRTGGGLGDEDEDEEPEDEDDAIRREKKGMGYELSSFNMKNEMEEGKFAEDGSFIRSYDPHQVHDKWMDGIDDREIKKARRLRKKMEEKEREREKREEEEGLAGRQKEELERELLEYVKPGESVLQTLTRLGSEKRQLDKAKPKVRSAKAALDPTVPVESNVRAEPVNGPSPIDRVTALASALMSMGNLHIYEETHRTLVHSVKESGMVPSDWVPPTAAPPPSSAGDRKYQYRWSPDYLASHPGGASANDIFGPFTKEELVAWRDAAYFGPSGDRIQLRPAGGTVWSDWSIVV
ncbi:hypothetical protein FRC03_010803 [Tulasnella sp. 419]|nr:hypothetical protein FRC03_010803 [Tulasnella sp. 419]